MIGDTTHDLDMAANARVAALGVSYGAHARAQLLAGCAEAVLDSSHELIAWLSAAGQLPQGLSAAARTQRQARE
jgi:phosphoglycolate phosphatase